MKLSTLNIVQINIDYKKDISYVFVISPEGQWPKKMLRLTFKVIFVKFK